MDYNVKLMKEQAKAHEKIKVSNPRAKCKHWTNLAIRKDGEVKPEDIGLCRKYSIVKDATGYCDQGKEKKDGKD